MKKTIWLLTTAVLTGTLMTGVNVQAKTALKVKVSPVKSGYYVTGKATSGSKITVTRYGKLITKGAANKKGIFKLKSKITFHQGWKYKVVITKHGYSSKSLHVQVKSDNKAQKSNLQALQNRINDLNDQLSTLRNTQVSTNNANTNDQAQLSDLQQKATNLQNQLNNVSSSSQQVSQPTDNTNYQAQINDLNNKVADLIKRMVGINDPNAGSGTSTSLDPQTQQKVDALNTQIQELVSKRFKVESDIADNSWKLQNMRSNIDYFESGDQTKNLDNANQSLSKDETALKADPQNLTLQAKISRDKDIISLTEKAQQNYKTASSAIGNSFDDYVAQEKQLETQAINLQQQETTLSQQIDAINQQVRQLTNGTTGTTSINETTNINTTTAKS
ncbi:MAG: hypothetical protein LKJ43_03225 [Lentilactobacillus buchneri]|jgi:predicted  nucleic acid-binding Zn-ribbon protein|nr:hypothetical protein [Lentilactobacillus buchneri]MCI1950724.1 hypothetical protein [Lentilactobacillus buchneri]MCI2018200.1 hypothetical protein [Lentilactobacillus buchneri]MCI2027850.1 hypothetical protein [Lentilactobacillus buchneri]